MNTDGIIWAGTVESFDACQSVQDYLLSPEHLNQVQTEGGIAAYNHAVYATYDEDDDDRVDDRGEHLMTIDGSTAIVNISGSLSNSYSPWNRFFGVVSYQEIRSAMQMALLDQEVTKVLINIDSNGGDAAGVDETARMISQIDKVKPVVAHTSTKALSGGYWLAVSARKFYASKTAQVGSIGVLVIHGTQHRQLKENGIDVRVFRAGTHKALGTPYEPLSTKAAADIQGRIDKLYGFFTSHVAVSRGLNLSNAPSWANGKVFFAEDGRSQNLIDGIAYFDYVVEKLDNSTAYALVSETISDGEQGMDAMNTKIETELAQISSGVGTTEVDATVDAATTDQDTSEQTSEQTQTKAPVDVDNVSTDEPTAKDGGQQQEQEQGVMQDKLIELSGKLAVAESQLEAKIAELTETEKTLGSLKTIAIQATNKLQIALNQSPSALDDLPAATVVESYNTALAKFGEVFGSGGSRAKVVKTETQETESRQGKIYPVA